MEKFKKYLFFEIGIEFKACLYFFAILFFYSMYRIIQGSFYAHIGIMAEMIAATYIMGYVQVFLLKNFEESEEFGKREILLSVLCSAVYTVAGWLLYWFDRNSLATALFFIYMLICFIAVCIIYRVRREIETTLLNQELEQFKKRKG